MRIATLFAISVLVFAHSACADANQPDTEVRIIEQGLRIIKNLDQIELGLDVYDPKAFQILKATRQDAKGIVFDALNEMTWRVIPECARHRRFSEVRLLIDFVQKTREKVGYRDGPSGFEAMNERLKLSPMREIAEKDLPR